MYVCYLCCEVTGYELVEVGLVLGAHEAVDGGGSEGDGVGDGVVEALTELAEDVLVTVGRPLESIGEEELPVFGLLDGGAGEVGEGDGTVEEFVFVEDDLSTEGATDVLHEGEGGEGIAVNVGGVGVEEFGIGAEGDVG